MTLVRTQYAKAGDVHIAYQVISDGPIDLVMVPGFVSHIECYWEESSLALSPPTRGILAADSL